VELYAEQDDKATGLARHVFAFYFKGFFVWTPSQRELKHKKKADPATDIKNLLTNMIERAYPGQGQPSEAKYNYKDIKEDNEKHRRITKTSFEIVEVTGYGVMGRERNYRDLLFTEDMMQHQKYYQKVRNPRLKLKDGVMEINVAQFYVRKQLATRIRHVLSLVKACGDETLQGRL
jgi:hypothetical protein